jgi:hypothetical protein
MAAPKITWYVKQGVDYRPETDYYAGTYATGEKVTLVLHVWNNRWGVVDTQPLQNAVMNMRFDTIEDSALLPNCKITVNDGEEPSILIRGQVASAALGVTLAGTKNNGDPLNVNNRQNFAMIQVDIDLTGGRFKANDLKNLYFELTTLDGQS